MADLRVVPKTQGRRGVGNSVEEKTLKTRQKGINMRKKKSQHAAAWPFRRCHRDGGSRERKVTVIAQRSRHSAVTDEDQKSNRDNRIARRYPGAHARGLCRLSGPGQAAPTDRQSSVSRGITEKAR